MESNPLSVRIIFAKYASKALDGTQVEVGQKVAYDVDLKKVLTSDEQKISELLELKRKAENEGSSSQDSTPFVPWP